MQINFSIFNTPHTRLEQNGNMLVTTPLNLCESYDYLYVSKMHNHGIQS